MVERDPARLEDVLGGRGRIGGDEALEDDDAIVGEQSGRRGEAGPLGFGAGEQEERVEGGHDDGERRAFRAEGGRRIGHVAEDGMHPAVGVALAEAVEHRRRGVDSPRSTRRGRRA